jgi:hypothetical protein
MLLSIEDTFHHSHPENLLPFTENKTFFTMCRGRDDSHGPPLKSWAYVFWAIALEVATLIFRITMQKYKKMPQSESFPNFEIPTWPVDYVGIERKFQLPDIKHHQNFLYFFHAMLERYNWKKRIIRSKLLQASSLILI